MLVIPFSTKRKMYIPCAKLKMLIVVDVPLMKQQYANNKY
jgi:hypothetical protein